MPVFEFRVGVELVPAGITTAIGSAMAGRNPWRVVAFEGEKRLYQGAGRALDEELGSAARAIRERCWEREVEAREREMDEEAEAEDGGDAKRQKLAKLALAAGAPRSDVEDAYRAENAVEALEKLLLSAATS